MTDATRDDDSYLWTRQQAAAWPAASPCAVAELLDPRFNLRPQPKAPGV